MRVSELSKLPNSVSSLLDPSKADVLSQVSEYLGLPCNFYKPNVAAWLPYCLACWGALH